MATYTTEMAIDVARSAWSQLERRESDYTAYHNDRAFNPEDDRSRLLILNVKRAMHSWSLVVVTVCDNFAEDEAAAIIAEAQGRTG